MNGHLQLCNFYQISLKIYVDDLYGANFIWKQLIACLQCFLLWICFSFLNLLWQSFLAL